MFYINSIIIKDINQHHQNDCLEVNYKITIRKNEYNLTYKISGENINSVPLLCDTVVVSLLVYAVKYGLYFFSEFPISEKLYYNLTKHVIPQLSLANKTANDIIKINMPLSKEVYHGTWVGTGVSLGVDSFTTIHEYKEECNLDEFKLTHLVHLKTGAHHGQLGYYNKQTEDDLFLAENTKVKQFCKKYNYKLITVESNLHGLICTEFGYGFDTTHTFRNLGCVLLLQNLFNKYYYASAYNLVQFEVNLSNDVAHYEKWIMPYISNDSVSLYSANTSMTRVQKTMFISNFEDTYDNLHICWHKTENCGKCKKCIRTIVTLDVLGVLNKYSKSFNLDNYYKNRDSVISEVIVLRKTDAPYMEIYEFMIKNKYKMPSRIIIAKTAIKIGCQKIKQYGISKAFSIIKRKIFKK